ncbi:NAD(P)/FAD-dependent oxidoreductase [Chitinophaga sancti]|uniref:NAD(P)/FAD-dependent oxidoreductase n=1 Tax=Chitinophaga sancti TaxID=1004 RepID=A0A1K1T2C5_9BACT|nr:NAD(P)/FAD-dependent oxidoreductase [Chitinophaga sancti]WQD59537.1 NAD(P)/FAD-dependent oxidoreductase [Chitinophaga sancti]WQG88329.1 NAD(P)/FAD-dependent oxidoreductase [Chitinophaga sancti]SFW90744.1 UDP-galactopyranose mutase [Chitinophaga sancti]
MSKKAIIIGAGPAGLTAAYEFLTRSDIIPVVLEKSGDIGGISKTINYKGNRMDIGGHRFFSKSDRVMKWWLNILPVVTGGESAHTITYQNKSRVVYHEENGITTDPDKVMLVRPRLSRIYFLRKFFSYPVQLSIDTLMKLGVFRTIGILFSYLKAQIWPNKPELTLEDFMINRFGKILYGLFFKDYTEKVWGVPCNEIPAEWGAQRIKGVSITKAIQHAVKSLKPKKASGDVSQKDTETSLIEQFFYPKLGPGQLWEEVAAKVKVLGGEILMHQEVVKVDVEGDQAKAITIRNSKTGETQVIEGDYFFSTMPVKELIAAIGEQVPENVQYIASNLQYRDFITVGLLLNNMSYADKSTGEIKRLELKDTWIYIQERDVKVGRLQIFNNWSPYLVADPKTTWVGMEFFCNDTDDFWKLPDEKIKAIAIKELHKIGLATEENVIDGTVLRVEKTYPAYFGAYERFSEIRTYVDGIKNLYLVGRNGMHKYNNADHSMLTAITAVDNILNGIEDKDNIWAINTEQDYHEEKKNDDSNGERGVKVEPTPEVVETSESKKKLSYTP